MKCRASLYRRHRFPPEIIQHAVWLYYRFSLSHRDIEDILARRGILVTHESIRLWCNKFGPHYAHRLRRGRGHHGRQGGFQPAHASLACPWRLADIGATLAAIVRRGAGQSAISIWVVDRPDSEESDGARHRRPMAALPRGKRHGNQEVRSGGQGRNRTIDTRIFSPLLYQLSYLATGRVAY